MEAYNFLGSSYFPKRYFRYSTHLDSELRYIYESIVSQSSLQPLYQVKPTVQSKDFAIALKDSSFALQTEMEAAFLGGETEVYGEGVKSLIGHINDLLQHTSSNSDVNHFSAALFRYFGIQMRRHRNEIEEAGLKQKKESVLFDTDMDFSEIKLSIGKSSFLFDIF